MIAAPNAAAIAWWPRQMPSSGVPSAAQDRTVSTLMPASAGAHGPGEITTPAGAAAATSAAVTSSLRTTSTCAPLVDKRCARFQVNES